MTQRFLLASLVLAACGSSAGDPRHAGSGADPDGAGSDAAAGEGAGGGTSGGEAPEAAGGGADSGGTSGRGQGGAAGPEQGGAGPEQGGAGPEQGGGAEGGDGLVIGADGTVTLRVGPAGGTLDGPHGASVTIPAGALDTTTEIALALDGSNAPSFPPAGVAVVGGMYEISPHGLSFGAPVVVRVPFEPYALPEDTSPALYKAEPGGEFEEIASTLDGDALVAEVSDFSVFTVGAYVAREYVYTNAGYQYAFDAARDTLSALDPSTVATGRNPWAVAVMPQQGFAYIGSDGESGSDDEFVAISQYSVGSGGRLMPLSPARVTLGRTDDLEGIGYLALHPSGKAVYATTWANGPVVRVLKAGSDGKLGAPSLVTPAGIADGRDPYGVKLDAKGEYAYVFGGLTPPNTLWQFAVAADGGLTPGPSAAITGVWAHDVALAPLAKHVYTLDWGSAASRSLKVLLYRQDDSGALAAPVTVTTMPAGTFSLDRIAITPDGRSAYVAGTKADRSPFIAEFAIKPDGTFGPSSQDTMSVPGIGDTFDIDPLGKYLFVGTVPDSPTRMYPIGASGILRAPREFRAGTLQAITGSNPFVFSYAKPGGCNYCGNGRGGGPITPPAKPQGPFTLTVSHGVWGGWITSTPVGIDFGREWVNGSPNQFSAAFAKDTTVVLCQVPPPSPVQAYKVIWTGDCSNNSNVPVNCASVVLDRDKTCHLELSRP